MPAMLDNSVQKESAGVGLIYLDFVITGVVMTLLGPMLPLLSARWILNDTQAGYLFMAQFAASIGGMLSSGLLVNRFGYRITLLFSLSVMAAGVAMLARANWMFGLVSVCVFGAGFGVNTPAANLRIARTNPLKAASALNLLNSCWGIGAMACPLLVAAAQRSRHVSLFLYGTSISLVALAVCLGRVRFTSDGPVLSEVQIGGSKTKTWDHHLLPIIAVLFFVYVGTENCVGGWVASYARRIDSHALWAMTPSFFWGALLFGRFTAPLVLRHVRETKLATLGVGMAAVRDSHFADVEINFGSHAGRHCRWVGIGVGISD